MKLNALEFALMNNPIRALSQRALETPLMFERDGSLAGQHVLEIGCGRGVGIEILLGRGAMHVTGFDLDPRMVELALKRLARHCHRVRVFVGDAEAIDAPDASFDAVVDYGILHHVPDWQKAIREVARVLRPGGAFHFEDILAGLVARPVASKLFDHPASAHFSGPGFRAALESAGLRVESWRQLGGIGVWGWAVKSAKGDR